MLFLVQPAKAQEYRPASPWNLHYGEDACELKRVFGNGTDDVLLQLNRSFSLEGATLYLNTKPFGKKRNWDTKVELLIEETGATQDTEARLINVRDEDIMVWQVFQVDVDLLKQLPDKATLRIRTNERPDIVLKLSGMKAVDKALRQCQQNLYERFGLDFGEIASLSRQSKPAGNPGRWVRADDYPSSAVKARLEGTVYLMLGVDPEGSTIGCAILRSSGHRILDDQTCRMLKKRSSFEPALDENGQAVHSNWISSVRWSLP